MPNWKVHLEVGKRINEKLKYQGEEYQMFLFGNILPDINNSYLVKNISVQYEHKKTHLVNGKKPTYEKYYDKYKNSIKANPVLIGYYVHLLTDYIWNNDFYSKHDIKSLEQLKSHEELRKIKQGDLKKYNNKFLSNNIEIQDYENLLKEIAQIQEVSINKADIIAVQNFLKEQVEEKRKYQYYNEEQLDKLMDKTIKEIGELFEKQGLI